MRFVLLSLAASLAVAAPAMAQSADATKDSGVRVDVHGGLGWRDARAVQGTVGGTLGYDVATGNGSFAGVEQSVDKVLTSQAKVRWTSAARFGMHVSPADKLYVLGGYAYGVGPNGAVGGAGMEHAMGPYFTKVEYRHIFTDSGARDSNAAVLGVGMRF